MAEEILISEQSWTLTERCMFHKFDQYEIVQMGSELTGAIRGWQVAADDTVHYNVRFPSGELIQVEEDDLTTTGHFETPFRVYEVVEIYPADFTEPEVAKLAGKRGVVTAIAPNDYNDHWGFSVAIQSGEIWYFEDHELESTGIIISHDILYGRGEGTVIARVSYNPKTDEETVLEGDGSLINEGPRPLRIKLDELVA